MMMIDDDDDACRRQRSTKLFTTSANVWMHEFRLMVDMLKIKY